MKKLLAAAFVGVAMFSQPVQAQEITPFNFCETFGDIARKVMMQRKLGVTDEEMIERASEYPMVSIVTPVVYEIPMNEFDSTYELLEYTEKLVYNFCLKSMLE